MKHEIMKIHQNLIKQNYFQLQGTIYIQEEGLPMGAPSSEIYLQYIENTKICDSLLKHHITGHFRYVDDILIAYKKDKETHMTTLIHLTIQCFL
jgi:hypothetical protein